MYCSLHGDNSGPMQSAKWARAHGTAEEAKRAREIINRTNPEALEQHQPSCATTKEFALTT